MPRQYAPNAIRSIRKARGLTMEELAHALEGDVGLTTIAKLERGQMGLTLDWMQAIAAALDVAVPDLLVPDGAPARRLPVVGLVSCGDWAEAVQQSEHRVIVPADTGGPRAFALEVVGRSMDRILPEGGLAIIDPDDRELRDRKIYAVANGDGETMVKQFLLDPPRLAPLSSDPGFVDLMLGEHAIIVIGRVTMSISRL